MKNTNKMLTAEELGLVSGGVLTDNNTATLNNMIALYKNGSTLERALTDEAAIWDEYEECGVPEFWSQTNRNECLDYIKCNW